MTPLTLEGPNGVVTEPTTTRLKERAILFGAQGTLVGIVTEPAVPMPGPRRALVVANVGFNHRVGPFRLYVELARHVAALGWYVLRFDLSGLGDSAAAIGARDATEQGVVDVREALDWLAEKMEIEQFVVAGLCSGVDSMHAVAVADPRVIGALFIDGYTYSTLGHRLRRHTLRYLQADRWRRQIRRRLAPQQHVDAAPSPVVFERTYPPRAHFQRDVAQMATRGTRLLFVYTGTVDADYNARGQLFEMLGSAVPPSARPAIEVERYAGADHLFSGLGDRAELFARVGTWLDSFDR